jgi:hypothetical protein
MQIVSFNVPKEQSKQPILKILCRRSEPISRCVGYTNGRHRTRYFRFGGAKQMPVIWYKNQAADLEQHHGV